MAKIAVSDLHISSEAENLMIALTEQETYSVKGGDKYYVIVDSNGNPVGVIRVRE